MKPSDLPVWMAAVLLWAACGSVPQSSSQAFDRLLQQDPDLHLGQFVAGWGPVSSIRVGDDHVTTFQVSDRGARFVVNYPNEIPELAEKIPVRFLGRVSGSAVAPDGNGQWVRAIRVQAIEVVNPQMRHYVTDELEYIKAWHDDLLPLR